ncbi:PEP-CTERM sorting domain-containing protein [Permianibacter sp. IMCC34836]|uniref:PEP-CTERM sorting domain-containing protein n=1 Tax=Permianibacter fluminis TaxID=2738515 RepID=UPI0015550E4D|nr:PEP-CTERM sorting domain-containing protein [Permianibacter fluminis]NQD36487.1 PEP-CTERM sorting domain-containing protein [Permianibacter fluminis]
MAQRRIGVAVATIAAALFGQLAQADLVTIHNGTIAMTTARSCSSVDDASTLDRCYENDAMTFAHTMREFNQVYNPGSSYASASATNALSIAGSNVTSAWVSAPSDATYLPNLHQQAYSGTEYARAGAHVALLQGYEWDGTGSADRSLDINFNYTGSDVTLYDDVVAADAANNRIDASFSQVSVWVFSLLGTDILIEDDFANDPALGACYFDLGLADCLATVRPDFQLLASTVLTADASGSDLSASLNFALDPTRTTFVWMQSMAWGRFGSFFDGSHTFTAHFDSIEGMNLLSDGANAVPEPWSLSLFSAGLLLMWTRRQRK